MKKQDHLVQDAMRNLISRSCEMLDSNNENRLYTFQKTLLKFFFGAADVTIDFEQKAILLWTSNPSQDDLTDSFYRMSDATPIRVSYTDLEETLKGCLENGSSQMRFYRSLLFQFNNVSSTDTVSAYSA